MRRKTGAILASLFTLALLFGSVAAASSIPERMTGNYIGTFIGDDYGSLRLSVTPEGVITGIAHSNVSLKDMVVNGQCGYDGTCEFTTEGKPMRFFGSIDFMNRFIGKWESTEGTGRGSFTAIINRD